MHCFIDFTIIFELKCYNDTESKWTELPDEVQQHIWRDLDSRQDDIKNFLLESYGVRGSVIKDRTMECCAHDREKLASFLNDTRGDKFEPLVSHKFREAVSWCRDDVIMHLTISDDDYHAAVAHSTARTDMAAAG